jgi:hypothetical protein
MQTLVHADIFFFISTIALVVLSVLLSIGLYYAIGVLRDVKEVSAKLKKASVDIEKDLEGFRNDLKAKGNKVSGVADMVLGFVARALTPGTRKRKKAEAEDL